VNFAAIILYVASQRVIPKVRVYFVMTQSGNFWIHSRMLSRANPKATTRTSDSTFKCQSLACGLKQHVALFTYVYDITACN
jgi:hypothetical protein